MDEYDEIPADVEAGSLEYWKHRARQWQKRCQRAEREKTEIIAMLNGQRRAELAMHQQRQAVLRGDSLGGKSGAPRPL